MSANKNLFFFWEPSGTIPAYLDLCIQTWSRAFREYNIIRLDYSTVGDYVESGVFPMDLLKQLALPLQKDAVMVAVLKEHGGIFMDVDTIAVANPVRIVKALEKTELVLFNTHLAMLAAKRRSHVLDRWLAGIQNRLADLNGREFSAGDLPWDYLGNAVLDEVFDEITGVVRRERVGAEPNSKAFPICRLHRHSVWQKVKRRIWLRSVCRKRIMMLDRRKHGFIVEASEDSYQQGTQAETYTNFWFTAGAPLHRVFSDKPEVIGLHNSWTPEWYKQLSHTEVLEHECLLSRTLKHLLAA